MREMMVIVAGLCWAAGAEARPNYPSQVPTPYGCETCHLDPNDRLNRNGFGIDFALERGLWVNPAQAGRGMCYLDSDFDGLTNGEELDDPSCLWRPGSRLPPGPTTHPGDGRDPDQCGDGVIIPLAEDCDRALPDGVSCQSMGYDEGELRCTPDCTFDTSDCRDLPPDMAPPPADLGVVDAGPADEGVGDRGPDVEDATPDARAVDGGADAIVDDSDAIVDDSDAIVDDSDAIADDSDATADEADGTTDDGPTPPPPPASDPGGCRADAGGGRGPAGLAALLLALVAVRRRR